MLIFKDIFKDIFKNKYYTTFFHIKYYKAFFHHHYLSLLLLYHNFTIYFYHTKMVPYGYKTLMESYTDIITNYVFSFMYLDNKNRLYFNLQSIISPLFELIYKFMSYSEENNNHYGANAKFVLKTDTKHISKAVDSVKYNISWLLELNHNRRWNIEKADEFLQFILRNYEPDYKITNVVYNIKNEARDAIDKVFENADLTNVKIYDYSVKRLYANLLHEWDFQISEILVEFSQDATVEEYKEGLALGLARYMADYERYKRFLHYCFDFDINNLIIKQKQPKIIYCTADYWDNMIINKFMYSLDDDAILVPTFDENLLNETKKLVQIIKMDDGTTVLIPYWMEDKDYERILQNAQIQRPDIDINNVVILDSVSMPRNKIDINIAPNCNLSTYSETIYLASENKSIDIPAIPFTDLTHLDNVNEIITNSESLKLLDRIYSYADTHHINLNSPLMRNTYYVNKNNKKILIYNQRDY